MRSRGLRPAIAVAAVATIAVGFLLTCAPSATATTGTCISTGTFTANGTCTLLPGESVVYTIKAGNGGTGGVGGNGGAGGTGWTGSATVAGGNASTGGTGGAGAAGRKIYGTYANTTSSPITISLYVGLNTLTTGTTGTNGAAGTNYSGTSTTTLTATSRADQIALNPAGTSVYTPDNTGNAVRLIDATTNTVSTWTGVTSASALGFRPGSTRMIVLQKAAGTGRVYDGASNTGGFTLSDPTQVAWTADGNYAFLTRPSAHKVTRFVNSNSTSYDVTDTSSKLTDPTGIAASTANSWAYVTQPTGGTLEAINTSTFAVDATKELTGLTDATGIVLNSAGDRAYVSQPSQNKVSVVDVTATPMSVVNTITGLNGATGVALNSDDSILYVAGNNSLTRIRTSDRTVIDTVTGLTGASTIAVKGDGSRAWTGVGTGVTSGNFFTVAYKSTGGTGGTGTNGGTGSNGTATYLRINSRTYVSAGAGNGGRGGLAGTGGTGGTYTGTLGTNGTNGTAGAPGTTASSTVPADARYLDTTNTEAPFIRFVDSNDPSATPTDSAATETPDPSESATDEPTDEPSVTPEPTPEPLPPPWYQAHGRPEGASCEAGWADSWAAWMNDGQGGFACSRVVFYRDETWWQGTDTDAPDASPWDGL